MFVLYHILPIPILNQTIIPNFPYYLLSLTDYMGISTECPKQEDTYLCPMALTTAHKEDCIPSMMKHFNPGTCPTIGIQLSTPILQSIDQNKLILVPVPNDPLDVIETCPNSIRHVQIANPTEITISLNCSLSYDNQIFINLPHKERHPSILLPSMDLHSNTSTTLKLDNVNLKDISTLYKNVHSLQPLQIDDFPEDNIESHLPTIGLAIAILIILIIILLVYCKARKQPFKFNINLEKRRKLNEESTSSEMGRITPSKANVGSNPTTSPSFIP